ncbi:MAG: hypothetical protein AAGE01_12750 [Pseudomonadota bacterium]
MQNLVLFGGFILTAGALIYGKMTGADGELLVPYGAGAFVVSGLALAAVGTVETWRALGVRVRPDGSVRFAASQNTFVDVPVSAITRETAEIIEHRSDDPFLPVRRDGHRVQVLFYEGGWYKGQSTERVFSMEVPGRAVFHLWPGDGRDFHILVSARLMPAELLALAENKLPLRKSDLIGG